MEKHLNRTDFYYDLPPELIAQHPAEKRDHSRMLHLDRKTGEICHQHFYDIEEYLRPGDVLVMNNSKVLPVRLFGTRDTTGAVVEFLLLEQKPAQEGRNNIWEALVKPGKRVRVGEFFTFGEGLLKAEILDTTESGGRLVNFTCDGNFYEMLDQIGQMPLPPYITERLKDKSRYQTVYAKTPGSAAAPTAGFHFTNELLEKLQQKGVKIAYVTLHVGLGTFRPVKEENILEHKMHTEFYTISEETAEIINSAKAAGGRVIAVGTTSCRTLESVMQKYGCVCAAEEKTDIFIYPGYTFGVIDGLITNFHLPESTLIMLVSAFAGYEHIMHAYHEAVEERYRFFSFGDCMAIL